MNTKDTFDNSTKYSIGIRLRQAREELRLSQKEIAERLHLKVSTVRDIEEDRTPSDLALTFLRGYIRSYAKLVHIPENELFPIINQEHQIKEEKTSPIQCFSLERSFKKYDKWLTIFSWLIFFIVVAITGIWWWQKYKEKKEEITAVTNQSDFRLYQSERKKRNLPLNNSDNLSFNKLQDPVVLFLPFQSQKNTRNYSTKIQN